MTHKEISELVGCELSYAAIYKNKENGQIWYSDTIKSVKIEGEYVKLELEHHAPKSIKLGVLEICNTKNINIEWEFNVLGNTENEGTGYIDITRKSCKKHCYNPTLSLS